MYDRGIRRFKLIRQYLAKLLTGTRAYKYLWLRGTRRPWKFSRIEIAFSFPAANLEILRFVQILGYYTTAPDEKNTLKACFCFLSPRVYNMFFFEFVRVFLLFILIRACFFFPLFFLPLNFTIEMSFTFDVRLKSTRISEVDILKVNAWNFRSKYSVTKSIRNWWRMRHETI